MSLVAVKRNPPRKFKVEDLISVIVRQQKKFEADGELESKKKFEVESTLEAFFKFIDAVRNKLWNGVYIWTEG